MTVLPTRKDAPPGHGGRVTARAAARPGAAVATAAPIGLVVIMALPGQRPPDLLACFVSLLAVAVLVAVARVASTDRRERPHRRRHLSRAKAHPPTSPKPLASPGAAPRSWSDPAVVSVDRWIVRAPGVAGVSAASWWVARAGTAGLLSSLAFRAVGASDASLLAAAAITAVALQSSWPSGRHLVHIALGGVALSGLVVSASGLLSLLQGRASTPLLPAEPLWRPSDLTSGVFVKSGTTVVVLCLAAVCLLALNTSGTRPASAPPRALWASIGVAVAAWAVVVPLLARTAGVGALAVGLSGGPRALTAAMAVLLHPLGGRSDLLAEWAIFIACLSGALGAASAATGLVDSARQELRSLPGRSAPAPWPAPAAPAAPAPAKALFARVPASALATAGAAAVAALLGPRPWFVVAIGALATGALALTSLAPPLVRQCQRVPGALRALVVAIWILAVSIALGAAGPLALGLVGSVTLAGAFAVGWRGLWKDASGPGRTGLGHIALPWGTAAAALVTCSAVTTLEILPTSPLAGSADMWRGLAVVATAAGISVLAVFPATARLRAENLGRAASTLAERALPALSGTLDALVRGEVPRLPYTELSELRAATRPLEGSLAGYRPSDDLVPLTRALVDASRQVARLAASVEAVSRVDRQRLEELVDQRMGTFAHANRNLVDSQWRRRQLLDRTVRVAEEERARIAANLHDGPIQRLAALGLVLDRCRLRLDREDKAGARELVKRARTELSAEIQSLRQLMSELRPPILDEGGLEAALRDHVASWSTASGIDTRFETTAHGVLSLDSETVVYRVVQEALANIAKHSRADLATVVMAQSGNGIQVTVRDNGRGFNADTQPDLSHDGHFGLVIMRERVELASGRFEIRSAPRTGTEVVVWVPSVLVNEPAGVA